MGFMDKMLTALHKAIADDEDDLYIFFSAHFRVPLA